MAATGVSLTALWLVVPLLVSVLFGIDAAVLTWLIYKVAIVLVTCFLGVYVPTLARSATQVSDGSFPSLPFLAVFVSGVPVQLFFPSGSGAEA